MALPVAFSRRSSGSVTSLTGRPVASTSAMRHQGHGDVRPWKRSKQVLPEGMNEPDVSPWMVFVLKELALSTSYASLTDLNCSSAFDSLLTSGWYLRASRR